MFHIRQFKLKIKNTNNFQILIAIDPLQVKSEVEGAQYIVKTGHRNLLPFVWEGD